MTAGNTTGKMTGKTACQVCGRKFGLCQDGTLRLHHVRSDACPGSGRAPFAVSCDAIEAEIERLSAASARWSAWWDRWRAGNMPPAEAERTATMAVERDLARMRRRRAAWDRRDWVEYWDPERESFRKRPPDAEAA